ncbi:MAG: VWA domain-containing protein [Planctomycetaceae bacterium]|nr:VWA domain-containing protein [Planctomycetaceae bacterium]
MFFPRFSNRLRLWLTLPAAAAILLSVSAGAVAGKRMEAELPSPATAATTTVSASEPLIQLAILLDTSGSMDGLIDQARCQLWTAVSEVAKARRDGQPVRLEIAVYQYGTQFVSKSKGSLRQICGFTDDLDEVSAALFGLHVKGGDEYCGEVISRAVADLDWAPQSDVYKSIFIAGNESFQQGEVTFASALPQLNERGVVVNTIFCQSPKYPADEVWQLAAETSGGRYSLIDHNHHLPNIPTPMDEDLVKLNEEMNETFVWFGNGGDQAAANQREQDANARKLSAHAFAARMSSKIGHLYHHVDHDLIDALEHKKVTLAKMPVEKMPETLQAMSEEERLTWLNGMITKRQSIRRRMADVISRRHTFLMSQLPGQAGQPVVLGDALTGVLTAQASDRGFEFEEDVKVTQAP